MDRAWAKRWCCFWEKVDLVPDGCWLWTGSRQRSGHGTFWFGHRNGQAHRWSYEQFVGPVPEGLQLDHLCCVPRCVNPWHLEPVTLIENVRRGLQNTYGSDERYCVQGHELEGINLYVSPDGKKACKECRREALRRSRARTAVDPQRKAEYQARDRARQRRYRERKNGGPLGPPNADKTHCPKGHLYEEGNIYREADGSRKCRTCVRERNSRAYRRRKMHT